MHNVQTFGLNCAACHTGQLVVNNARNVVDGGASLYDIQNWDSDLGTALDAVAHSDQKLQDMQQAIAARNPQSPYANDLTQLKTDLNSVFEYIDGRAKRNVPVLEYGWGRFDAFTLLFNDLLVHEAQLTQKDAQGNYVNSEIPASPVSQPYLWTVPDLQCVQTNCVTSDPMARNLGETIGVYGSIRLRDLPDSTQLNLHDLTLANIGTELDISADPNKLYALEHSLNDLPSPKWQPEFGALDSTQVKRGAEIYANKVYSVSGSLKSCATCHVLADPSDPANLTPPNTNGHQYLKVTRWSPTDTGTDTAFLDQQTARTVTGLPPLLASVYDAVIYQNQPQRLGSNQPRLAADFLGLATGLAMQKWYKVNNISLADQARYKEYQVVTTAEDLNRYKARPLNGIAFTAPHLHDGSVPTLEQLFTKPADRVKTFPLGTLSWDTQNVGYKT